MFPTQNRVERLTFFLSALNLKKDLFSINKQITIVSIIMQTQAKFCACFTESKLPLILKVGSLTHIKKLLLRLSV